MSSMIKDNIIILFKGLRITDINKVGGKNASLGEMVYHLGATGIKIAQGFAISADACLIT